MRVAILLFLTASILTHRVDIAVVLTALFLFGMNVTFGAAWSVLVLYARERLGMGAVGFGQISTRRRSAAS